MVEGGDEIVDEEPKERSTSKVIDRVDYETKAEVVVVEVKGRVFREGAERDKESRRRAST
jgi:hypothetical protein